MVTENHRRASEILATLSQPSSYPHEASEDYQDDWITWVAISADLAGRLSTYLNGGVPELAEIGAGIRLLMAAETLRARWPERWQILLEGYEILRNPQE